MDIKIDKEYLNYLNYLNEIKKETQNNWIDSRTNNFGKINLY